MKHLTVRIATRIARKIPSTTKTQAMEKLLKRARPFRPLLRRVMRVL
jgi:hypothetical protein